MKKPPCDPKCEGRCPGCHDHCEKYKAWKKELEKAKEYLRKENKPETISERCKRVGWQNKRYGSRHKPVK